MPDAQIITEIKLSQRVSRRDGTVEDLGTVAYWHRNPIKRLAARIIGLGRITPNKG